MPDPRRVSLRNQADSLVAVLELIRSGDCRTRAQLAEVTGLGRNIVAQRVADLVERGIVAEGTLGASTGGRAPRELEFLRDAGAVLVASLGASQLRVGVSDLSGRITARRDEPISIADGPEPVLARVAELLNEVRGSSGDVWGIGIAVPGPVEFSTGRPIAPPIMPGWDEFDIRGYFQGRFSVPVWVDNDANVIGLGELRAGLARGEEHALVVKVGSGIGAALISNGRLHRGAQGSAGDVGHISAIQPEGMAVVCRCGNLNCLEALAGGMAIARDATAGAAAGESPFLAKLLEQNGAVDVSDVARAARHGDRFSVELLARSARLVGENVARMVNFFNPGAVVLGGRVIETGDSYLATVRQLVMGRALPLATRSLRIVRTDLGNQASLVGAAYMVLDELFSLELLAHWIDSHPTALTGTLA